MAGKNSGGTNKKPPVPRKSSSYRTNAAGERVVNTVERYGIPAGSSGSIVKNTRSGPNGSTRYTATTNNKNQVTNSRVQTTQRKAPAKTLGHWTKRKK
jgi:hypothetical protein